MFTRRIVPVQFWKGGESLRAQARGGKSELQKARCRATPGRREIRAGDPGKAGSTDSATENKPPGRFGVRARVKRWCKRPPLREKSRGHGKPQIGRASCRE